MSLRTLVNRATLGLFAAAVALAAADSAPHNRLTAQERAAGYVLLFDGETLAGWEGDSRYWSVRGGAIVGSSDVHSPPQNTFLSTTREYANFVLQAEIRLRNGNSGIQFRSARLPDAVVTGYQADASDARERSAWGNFYEEKGRGRGVMKTPTEGWRNAKPVYRQGEWNHYEILADGDRIRLKLNGQVTIDLRDDRASEGVIALQLHQGDPMEVEFRNIKLKMLP